MEPVQRRVCSSTVIGRLICEHFWASFGLWINPPSGTIMLLLCKATLLMPLCLFYNDEQAATALFVTFTVKFVSRKTP